ncbi:MAG: PhaM family polyhydroxyalkanoate granule multifunctional regulatory protein [Aquabacterium sp.]|jgi:hypothetical protein
MSSPSSSPDPQQAASEATQAFANMSAAGVGLFQDWLKAASSAVPPFANAGGAGSGAAPSSPLGTWSLPTLDPEELDKRIQDLRTVQFWLEQNARMIAMTIQGLEVQKMTLNTLKGMNVSLDSLRETLQARATPEPAAPEPATAKAPPTSPTEARATDAEPATANSPQADLINPMRWWDTLAQQFTTLAAQAAQPMAAAAQAAAEAPATPSSTKGSRSKATGGGTRSATSSAASSSTRARSGQATTASAPKGKAAPSSRTPKSSA